MDSNYPDVVLRPGGGRRCRVLFSYSPQNEDELQLQVNDEIDFLAEVEDGWWRGKLRNKIGVFPSNFVCEIPPPEESCGSEGETSAPLSSPDSNTDAPVLPPKPVKETCRVLFAYEAANDDELTLKKDDVITIITKEVEDKGWWKGELRGKIGLFPDNFVELIAPAEEIVQQKKPDRPTKIFEKIESKIPLISSVTIQKKMQDVINHKDQDPKSDGLFGKKTTNAEKGKFDGKQQTTTTTTTTATTDKNLNLFQIKQDTVTTHRRSLEMKANENPPIASKKPVLPPPLTNKPKPAANKPNQVKRLSGEVSDIVESFNLKRLSGEDFLDGGGMSKHSGRTSGGSGSEDLDLDSVERSDMLTHITASRPKAPGRRPPTKEPRENDIHSYLTNGNLDTSDKEKNQREWEKHKPPWVDELKSNLKSTKGSTNATATGAASPEVKPEKKSPLPGLVAKPLLKSPSEPQSTDASKSNVSPVRQLNQLNLGQKPQQQESGWKVSELSNRYSAEVAKASGLSTSPSKLLDHSKHLNSLAEHANGESVQVSKKEFTELQGKVEYLEEIVMHLMNSLREETEKRKLIEKELSKLTNLVTQV